jgi:hypothetical protein
VFPFFLTPLKILCDGAHVVGAGVTSPSPHLVAIIGPGIGSRSWRVNLGKSFATHEELWDNAAQERTAKAAREANFNDIF